MLATGLPKVKKHEFFFQKINIYLWTHFIVWQQGKYCVLLQQEAETACGYKLGGNTTNLK